MSPGLRETLSHATARVVGSRFAKPIARVAAAAAGLLLLAFIGKNAVAGAMAASATSAAVSAIAAPVASLGTIATAAALVAAPTPLPTPEPAPAPAPAAHTQATSDDPVILNTATVDDLRRLPGIGEKRANAILALRSRLGGHFRAVEDLLKVKGIGRATLRRLRPLVRLDPLPEPASDAGTGGPR